MTSKGVFAIIALIAIGAAAYFALAPVTTDVSMSMLPDIPIVDMQVRVGSKLGVTVGPDGSVESVDCGSPARRNEISVEPANRLAELFDDLLDGARKVEDRIVAACDAALRRHRQNAVIAGFAAAAAFLAAMLSAVGHRSSLRREQRRQERAEPATHSASPTTPSSWPTGPPPERVVPSGIPPPSPPGSISAHSRRPVVIGGAFGAAVFIVASIAWAASRGPDRSSGEVAFGSPSTVEDPRLAAERQCIQDTIASADGLFDVAAAASSADLDTDLNRDGDSSWRQYAVDIQSLNVGSCPADFQSALIDYTSAWREYGDAWLDATDGLIKDGMSDDDHQRYETRVNQARSLVEAVAREHGVTLGALTFDL